MWPLLYLLIRLLVARIIRTSRRDRDDGAKDLEILVLRVCGTNLAIFGPIWFRSGLFVARDGHRVGRGAASRRGAFLIAS